MGKNQSYNPKQRGTTIVPLDSWNGSTLSMALDLSRRVRAGEISRIRAGGRWALAAFALFAAGIVEFNTVVIQGEWWHVVRRGAR